MPTLDGVKYVDWVETVLLGIRDAKAAQPTQAIMLSDEALAKHLGVADEEHGLEAVRDAVRDLIHVNAVESANNYNVKLTPVEGKRLVATSLRVLWPEAEDIWLDEHQTQFLSMLVRMSERRAETHAWLDDVEFNGVLAALPWEDEQVDLLDLLNGLRITGMIDGRFTIGGNPKIFPTYAAIVKITEATGVADTQRVRDLLKRWEGVNVDFKRQLSLKTKDDKAEFVRDVLSLANPQVVGDRYIVIGFDSKTRRFVQSVDPKITQDHMEDLLNEYTESEYSGAPVAVRYRHVAWTDPAGTVGLIEILREVTDVAYRVKKGLKGLKKEIRLHQIPVRHSSHVAEPDEPELAGLRAEAQWARSMVGLAPEGVRSKARSDPV